MIEIVESRGKSDINDRENTHRLPVHTRTEAHTCTHRDRECLSQHVLMSASGTNTERTFRY